MNNILNIILGAAALIFVLYMFTVGRGDDADKGKTVISFLSAGTRQQKEAYDKVIAAFEKEHPDVKVRFEWGTSGDFFGVLLTRMAGGVAPDVTFMYEFKMPFFADKRTLLDLTPYIEREFKDDFKDFHPVAKDIFSYGGKVYAMPVTLAPLALFYNKRLFDQEGITYPDATWTWEMLLDNAKRLTKRDENGKTIQYGLAAGIDYRMIEMLTGHRGVLANPTRANYDDKEIVDAVRFSVELANTHRVAPDVASLKQESRIFESGKGAMGISGNWMCPTYNAIKSLDYDVAPIPKWRGGHRGTYTHAVGYSISSESKHKDAAWKFVKFLGSSATLEMLSVLGDTVPARISVLRSPSFLSDKPEHKKVFAESLDYSYFLQITNPPLPDYYQQAVDAMNIGQGIPEEVLPEVKRRVNYFINDKKVKLLK